MHTIDVQQPINLKVVRFELDFISLDQEPKSPKRVNKLKEIRLPNIKPVAKKSPVPPPPKLNTTLQSRNVKELIDELLEELYADHRDWNSNCATYYSRGSTSDASVTSYQSNCEEQTDAIEQSYLEALSIEELQWQASDWLARFQTTGERLARCLRARDRLKRQQKRLCAAFSVLLQHINFVSCMRLTYKTEEKDVLFGWFYPYVATESVNVIIWNCQPGLLPRQMSAILNSLRNLAGSSRASSAGEPGVRFGLTPADGPGEGGYSEWLHAMRLVARLPAGVPQHFRKKLWLTLAERHLTARSIEWPVAERACFRGTAQPDDAELGAQILKDLHRTGCSLFCGTEGRENQAMLRRVLLAYARWNKDVGYCQGFNMLAAIILEVMEKSESDSLKVMIYLVEAVLPEGYFADDLRGLSADMAAFRDLLRLRLPRLAHHMDHLQRISDGGGVEPPLPDVFTMQWFLTLYATWLPRESLLRVWDLVLLDGNEVLLLTALAIWDLLQDRILSARSADEFYSCMGGGAGAVWAAGEALVARVVAFGAAPELPRLRSLHRYRVAPPQPAPPPLHAAMQSMTKRGLRLFYSEDEGDSSDDGNKMALATVIPRREDRIGAGDRLSLDIGALKRQYARLRERQRQAHVILAAACARHAAVGVPTSPTSLTVNNLLLGKSAIVSSRGRRLGPPPGAVPPTRQTSTPRENTESSSSARSTGTISWDEEKSRKSLSRRNSVKWKDIKKDKSSDNKRKASIDLDEAGDGIIVSELEASQMIASLRSRSSSETSSYSSRTASSTDTSLCDENEKASDSETDLPNDEKEKTTPFKKKTSTLSPLLKDLHLGQSPILEDQTKILNSPKLDFDICKENSVKNITDYLDSAAGEPLRAYIDGFDTKLKENLTINRESDISLKPLSPLKGISPFSPIKADRNDILQRLSSKNYDEISKGDEISRPKSLPKPSKNFAELSPLDLSSDCKCDVVIESPYIYDFESNFKPPDSTAPRPPDIIDSFTMYPNFVPDIDLSEKNVSDIDSPPRSPGAESIIVSEDEPPIPLKIDKYFEHSPEFFGARVTDPYNSDIPNRRAVKRYSRLPKKPDSLTLQSNNNDKVSKADTERASSLPQSLSFTSKKSLSPDMDVGESDKYKPTTPTQIELSNTTYDFLLKKKLTPTKARTVSESMSPKDYILQSGRKNSERALQIIQENSKILNRILTKQHINDSSKFTKLSDDSYCPKDNKSQYEASEKVIEDKQIDSPLLKESTSDSVIGYRKRIVSDEIVERSDFVRVRPISIDDPFSLDARNAICKDEEFCIKTVKPPSNECLGNKTDLYGWENKGFLVKSDYMGSLDKTRSSYDYSYKRKISDILELDNNSKHDLLRPATTSEWTRHSFSGELRTSCPLPSTELKDTPTYDKQYTSDDYNYPFSSRYNDFVLSKASDICSKTIDQGPKACEKSSKTDNSQVSDFAHVVTSSISFTYEPSAEEDSPTGIKSNSSDTLCQITSLDQVSTPISPKIFPRETPTFPKEYVDKSDRTIVDTDDTCSTITSLIETTDTLSSLSYPRSPSSGSYHPFPTRPSMRMPKELGFRLGMYPKDTINSPPK